MQWAIYSRFYQANRLSSPLSALSLIYTLPRLISLGCLWTNFEYLFSSSTYFDQKANCTVNQRQRSRAKARAGQFSRPSPGLRLSIGLGTVTLLVSDLALVTYALD